MLSLSCSQITDDSVPVFNHFPKVEMIDLSDTQIGDAGIHKLKISKSLQSLGLSRTKISLQSLRYLKSFPPYRIRRD